MSGSLCDVRKEAEISKRRYLSRHDHSLLQIPNLSVRVIHIELWLFRDDTFELPTI